MRQYIPVSESVAKWEKDPAFVEAYGVLEEEFALAVALIDAHLRADLAQETGAKRMGTTTDTAPVSPAPSNLPPKRSGHR